MPEQTPRRSHRRPPRAPDEFDLLRPFTRKEALEAGLTDAALRSRAFRRLLHGVYVDSSVALTPDLVAEALLLIAPGVAWVSHASAARMHGTPLPPLPEEHFCVVEAGERSARRGVRCHVGQPDARVIRRHGLQYSSPAQVFVELAEQLTLVDLVVAGDWLVRKKLVTLDRLRTFVTASSMRGSAAARVAVAFVRERVDSPMETRLRMLFVLAGFPEPEVNLTLDVAGQVRRFDLSWPGVKVIAEYDGRHHVQRAEQWEADLERREQIDDDEWRIRVFVARDVYNTPDRTLERMAKVLRERRLPGMPPRLRDGWRPYFPIRNDYL